MDTSTQSARKTGTPIVPVALAVFGGIGGGLLIWGWLNYGEAIYLNRLAAVLAGCF